MPSVLLTGESKASLYKQESKEDGGFKERKAASESSQAFDASSCGNDFAVSDEASDSHEAHRLAVFDFDGTCLSGNSPVMLVRHLAASRQLSLTTIVKIIGWALAYKFRLPQKEESARSLVFTAFEGQNAEKVDSYLRSLYDEKVEPRYRKKADKAMLERMNEGCDVVVLSASFEPFIERAMEKHPFCYQVSTRMRISDDGCYTKRVDGLPIEGEEKLNAIRRFADRTFGAGNWEIEYAYGDHHSDATVLKSAKKAFAVTPDKPLTRIARNEGWEILDWT